MNWENCRLCENCCKCCSKRNYKDDCDLCTGQNESFQLADHIKHCPANGERVKLPLKKSAHFVVIRPSGPTRKDMEEAISRFLKEHPYI